MIFVVATLIIRLMGKRQLGELEPYEVVITIMIAELALLPMEDMSESLLEGIIPMVTLYLLHTLISYLCLKLVWFRGLLCGKATPVIEDGCILIDNLKRQDYSMDELLEQLREQGIFDINQVDHALLEAGGTLSVLKKPDYQPPVLKDLGKTGKAQRLPKVLVTCGKPEKGAAILPDKLMAYAKPLGFTQMKDIFFACLTSENLLFIQGYQNNVRITEVEVRDHAS